LAIGGLDGQQTNEEFENRVCGNGVRNAAIAIGEMGAHSYSALTASPHAFDAVLEPSDHAALPEPKRIFLVLLDTVAAIQKEAVFQFNGTPSISHCAVSYFYVLVLNAAAASLHKLPNV
jgi:hypothetical protein